MTPSTTAIADELLPSGEAGELATRALLAALSGVEDEGLVEAARGGHSPSARALVNATDLTGALTASVAEAEPSDALRARLLGSVGRSGRAKPLSVGLGSSEASSDASSQSRSVRALCEILADQHAAGPVDEARRAQIAALDAGGVIGGAPAAAAADREIALLLERMAPFIPAGALFVSVVRGPHTIHRVHRGFPAEFGDIDIVPRFVSFCTHTVSANGTFVVHDASREAFFRRSTVATKFGARSYVGVPLRVAAARIGAVGAAVGALCAIQFGEGRRVPDGEVRFFEHCALHAEAIVAKRDASAILVDGVYSEDFFRRLLAIEVERARETPRAVSLAFGASESGGFRGRIGARVACLSFGAGAGAPVDAETRDADAWIARAVAASR